MIEDARGKAGQEDDDDGGRGPTPSSPRLSYRTSDTRRRPEHDADLEVNHAFDHEHVLCAALQSLPARWQQVLWYADVLQETPHVIAPRMGLAPKAASALIRRARTGLRRAYLSRGPVES